MRIVKKAKANKAHGVRSNTEHSGNSVNTDEAVRARAYQLYEERGRVDGQALNDWLTAEAQIMGNQS